MRLIAGEVGSGRFAISGFFPEWAAPTYKIARVLVVALCVVIIYPFLPGSGSPAFQGVSVFLGVLVSLGSTSAIANVMAGLVITYMRPFQLRDRLRIGDSEGQVIEKTLLVVRLRTLEGVEITVPNSALLQTALQNYTAPLRRDEGLVVETSVTIGYDVPWRTVEQLMLTAARATPGVVERPPPEVWQAELSDFYVKHTLRAAVGQPGRGKAILAALNQQLLESFFAAGVEIMSPHYVSARDGNTVAIPPAQRPAGAVPAFRHRLVALEETGRAEAANGPETPERSAPERH
jgi:small-conductance mechanosensitive channel